MEAEQGLKDAKKTVPSYTAQWDAKDYYAEEQEARNRAADTLLEVVRRLSPPVVSRPSPPRLFPR